MSYLKEGKKLSGNNAGYSLVGAIKNPNRDYKYMKILNYLVEHQGEEFGRWELMIKSGFVDKKTEDYYNRLFEGEDTVTYDGQVYHWISHAKNGYMCGIFTEFRLHNILKYNAKTKKWSTGDYFREYMTEVYEAKVISCYSSLIKIYQN